MGAQLKPNGKFDCVAVCYTKEDAPDVFAELGDCRTREHAVETGALVVRHDYEPIYECHTPWMDPALAGAPVHYLKTRRAPLEVDLSALPEFALAHFDMQADDEMLNIRYDSDDDDLAPAERRLSPNQSIVVGMYLVLEHNKRVYAKLPAPPALPRPSRRTGEAMLRYMSQLRAWKAMYGSDLVKLVVSYVDGQDGDAPSWTKGSSVLGHEQRRVPIMGEGEDTDWGFYAARCVVGRRQV